MREKAYATEKSRKSERNVVEMTDEEHERGAEEGEAAVVLSFWWEYLTDRLGEVDAEEEIRGYCLFGLELWMAEGEEEEAEVDE